MATTVEAIIKRTLKDLIIAGAEISLQAIHTQDYIFALNNLVAELESESEVDLSWTTIATASDTLGCPDGCVGPLATLMARDLAPSYGVPIMSGTDFKLKVDSALDTILVQCTTITGSYKPATLPKGSGNREDFYSDSEFYTGTE